MDGKQLQEISIRKAQLEDAEAICHVHVTSVQTLCVNDYRPEQIKAWVGKLTAEARRNAILQRGETMFVAEIEGAIAGVSSLFKDEIYAVYVYPSYTRQGVGTLLLGVVEKEAIARNIKKLKLAASTNAKPFYQSRGYKVIKHSFHTLRSGVQIPCVYMEKTLA